MIVGVYGEDDHIRLSVSDSGPGVPPEALARLTEAFFRVDTARTGEGNGLGLAIAQQMAQMHGARLQFENQQPSGLRVSVTFPRSSSEPPALLGSPQV